jgi:hypothetical protein
VQDQVANNRQWAGTQAQSDEATADKRHEHEQRKQPRHHGEGDAALPARPAEPPLDKQPVQQRPDQATDEEDRRRRVEVRLGGVDQRVAGQASEPGGHRRHRQSAKDDRGHEGRGKRQDHGHRGDESGEQRQHDDITGRPAYPRIDQEISTSTVSHPPASLVRRTLPQHAARVHKG